MLIQRFINTLPNRKDEEIMFDELSQRDERSKRTDEEKIFQNKCVSSQQTKCAKMAPP